MLRVIWLLGLLTVTPETPPEKCHLPPVSYISGGHSSCLFGENGAMTCRYELREVCMLSEIVSGMYVLYLARLECQGQWHIMEMDCE